MKANYTTESGQPVSFPWRGEKSMFKLEEQGFPLNVGEFPAGVSHFKTAHIKVAEGVPLSRGKA